MLSHIGEIFNRLAGRLRKSWAIARDRRTHKIADIVKDISSTKNNKVVIWGHKLHSHTHSYIHDSYYRAFKNKGHDVYWFDDEDNVSGFNFDNCLFLTEGQVQNRIPLNRTSVYILHNCELSKYKDNACRYLNLFNYVNDCKLGRSFNFPGSTVDKLTYYSYYDVKNSALYQPWGTDLLPEEINGEPLMLNRKNSDIYYIGSLWEENAPLVASFAKACADNRKRFIHKRFVSKAKAIDLVRRSYISPDIRGGFHIEVGYIPCRIFKNISYGCIPATNSHFVRDFFGDGVLPFAKDSYDLFEANESFLGSADNKETARWLKDEIKKHHTYMTRVDTILSLI